MEVSDQPPNPGHHLAPSPWPAAPLCTPSDLGAKMCDLVAPGRACPAVPGVVPGVLHREPWGQVIPG